MKRCPGTDALTTIASALEWDVEDGVRHLNTCPECAQQLRALQLTYLSYEESAEVSPAETNSIMHAIAEAGKRERAVTRRKGAIGDFVEALLAGGTAVTVLNGFGGGVPSNALVLTFAIVATALFGYRKLDTNERVVGAVRR